MSGILKFPDFSLTLSVFPDRKNPAQHCLAVLDVSSVVDTSDVEQIGLELSLESVQCHLLSP